MSRETRINKFLTQMSAIVVALLLVAFVPATYAWAETESDIEIEAEASEGEGQEDEGSEVVTYQQIAQWRANAMARLHTLSHSIQNYHGAGCPGYPGGIFEGIGSSAGGTPGTCNNGGGVLADAMAVSSSGMVYRVRFSSTTGGSYNYRGGGRRWRRR